MAGRLRAPVRQRTRAGCGRRIGRGRLSAGPRPGDRGSDPGRCSPLVKEASFHRRVRWWARTTWTSSCTSWTTSPMKPPLTCGAGHRSRPRGSVGAQGRGPHVQGNHQVARRWISGGISVLPDAPTCAPERPTCRPPRPRSHRRPAPVVPVSCTTITSPAPSQAPVYCAVEERAVSAEAVADVGFAVASILILPYGFPCGIAVSRRAVPIRACPVDLGSSTAYVTFAGGRQGRRSDASRSTPGGDVEAVIVALRPRPAAPSHTEP